LLALARTEASLLLLPTKVVLAIHRIDCAQHIPPQLVRQTTEWNHFTHCRRCFGRIFETKREGKEKGLPLQTNVMYSVSNIMATKKQGATTKKTAAKKTAVKKTAAKKTTAKKTAAKKAPAKKTAAKKATSKKSASKATKKASTKRA
jgi:hypothetical protein